MKNTISILITLCLLISGCATGRDDTSKSYLPAWENHYFTYKNPNDLGKQDAWTSTSKNLALKLGRLHITPLALIPDIIWNVYLIPTWPIRRIFKGDKRLLFYYPPIYLADESFQSEFEDEWQEEIL